MRVYLQNGCQVTHGKGPSVTSALVYRFLFCCWWLCQFFLGKQLPSLTIRHDWHGLVLSESSVQVRWRKNDTILGSCGKVPFPVGHPVMCVCANLNFRFILAQAHRTVNGAIHFGKKHILHARAYWEWHPLPYSFMLSPRLAKQWSANDLVLRPIQFCLALSPSTDALLWPFCFSAFQKGEVVWTSCDLRLD